MNAIQVNMSNIASPSIVTIDGVTFRCSWLDDRDKVKARIEEMMNWLPAVVWAAIKEADVDLQILETWTEANEHGTTRILSDDRICLTLDPLLLRLMRVDHPFTAVAHMVVLIEVLTDRSMIFNDMNEDEQAEAGMMLMATKLKERGAIKSIAKRMKMYRRVHQAQKLFVSTVERVAKRIHG